MQAYAGVDPTARSLHLGHLIAFMPLFWMYLHGYGGYTLIGGSTARIGDPTGRTESRPILPANELVQNLATIQHQLKAIWENVERTGQKHGYEKQWAWKRGIPNNNAWWNKQPMLEVLKRLGAFLRLGPMLGRDNVKTRLDDGSGMSFSEFCYPLMQGWDWFQLYKQLGIQLQIGGSDQYGNILTGAECVKHCVQSEPDPNDRLPMGRFDQPIGFTVPLLTDASGAKFGKSAGNAIWLDPFMTPPYDMYGYLMRRSDAEVERLLKVLTFHPQEKIKEVMEQHELDQRQRVAQRLLAHEVVSLIHGTSVAIETAKAHRAMYGARSGVNVSTTQTPEQYSTAEGQMVTATESPRVDLRLPWSVFKQSLARILYASGVSISISEGNRDIKAGGVYLGGNPGGKGIKYQTGMKPEQLQFVPVKAWDPAWNKQFLIDGKLLLIRKGKHNLRCIEFIRDDEFRKAGLNYPGQPENGAFRKAVNKIIEKGEIARAKKSARGELLEEDRVSHSVGDDPEVKSRLSNERLRREVQTLAEDGLVRKEMAPDEPW